MMDLNAQPLFTHQVRMYLNDKSYLTKLALYSDGSERMAGAGFSGEIIDAHEDTEQEQVTITTKGRWYGKIRTITIAAEGWHEFRERVAHHRTTSPTMQPQRTMT
jgi:hypothetical protein